MSLSEALMKDGLEGVFCKGLGALRRNSTNVHAENTRQIIGSADIDTAMKSTEPEAPRWDYVIEYDGMLYFVEIHSADGDKCIDEVVKKRNWLVGWLKRRACNIEKLPRYSLYLWVASKKIKNTHRDSSSKQLAAYNIKLVKSPVYLPIKDG